MEKIQEIINKGIEEYEKNNKISVFSIVCRIYNGFL